MNKLQAKKGFAKIINVPNEVVAEVINLIERDFVLYKR
jgi:hypothetical protein